MGKRAFGFDDSVQMFLQYLEGEMYSSETLLSYKKDLESFKRFMVKKIDEIDFSLEVVRKEELLDFMEDGRQQGHQTSTIGRRISTLKSFYKFLVYELDFPENVAIGIRVPKEEIPLGKILTEDEVKRLLQSAQLLNPSYHLLFSVLYYTGAYLTPVQNLERDHVDLVNGTIYFPKVKGGKELYLPLHNQLKEQFEVYFAEHLIKGNPYVFPSSRRSNQPLSASDIRNKLRLAASQAGLESSISPHMLRHCRAMHLTDRNVPQRTIANILGHSDLRSTMRYQDLTAAHLKDSLNVL